MAKRKRLKEQTITDFASVFVSCRLDFQTFPTVCLRNKSQKPECVGSFNMDWWILVFYPEPEARDKMY